MPTEFFYPPTKGPTRKGVTLELPEVRHNLTGTETPKSLEKMLHATAETWITYMYRDNDVGNKLIKEGRSQGDIQIVINGFALPLYLLRLDDNLVVDTQMSAKPPVMSTITGDEDPFDLMTEALVVTREWYHGQHGNENLHRIFVINPANHISRLLKL